MRHDLSWFKPSKNLTKSWFRFDSKTRDGKLLILSFVGSRFTSGPGLDFGYILLSLETSRLFLASTCLALTFCVLALVTFQSWFCTVFNPHLAKFLIESQSSPGNFLPIPLTFRDLHLLLLHRLLFQDQIDYNEVICRPPNLQFTD